MSSSVASGVSAGVNIRLAVASSPVAGPLLGIAHLAKVACRFSELDNLLDLMALTLELGCQAAGYRHGWIISRKDNEILSRNCTDGVLEQTLLNAVSQGTFQNNSWCRSFAIRLTDDTWCDAYFAGPVGKYATAALDGERKQVLQLLSVLAGPALAGGYRAYRLERQKDIADEVARGAAMQKMFFPPRSGTVGEFRFTGESRVGKLMHGDFFDVIALDNDRIAVTLGDVAGKGIAASVIGTSVQSFLRASLPCSTSLADTVTKLNDFLLPRRPEGSFATAFIAIADRRKKVIEYIDAGHGYGFLVQGNRQLQRLDQGGGPPIGAFGGFNYEPVVVPLVSGERLLIVSDGVVEQQARRVRHWFDIAGLERVAATTTSHHDLVGEIFKAVVEFAETTPLSDDATALVVDW